MIEKKTIKSYIDEMKAEAKQFKNITFKDGYLEALEEVWNLIETNKNE